MKKSTSYLFIAFVTLGLLAFTNLKPNANSEFKSSFTETLKNAKAYTLEVAEKMPAEDYTFRPHDSVRTFGEQLAHLSMSSSLLNKMFIKGEQVNFDPAEGEKMMKMVGASKEETIKVINTSFDEVIATIESMSDEDLQATFVFGFAPNKPELTKEQGFLFIRDHVTHHRAQAVTYLRIKGHDAPQYRPF